jgi:hypothetical protein
MLSGLEVYKEIEKHESRFPDLKRVDEIWIAHSAALESEQYVVFELVDHRGRVEALSFADGVLLLRRDYRPYPPAV